MRIKRSCQAITCDVCGNVFNQLRPWRAYCSKRCRRDAAVFKRLNAPGALAELRGLQAEVDRLRSILKDNAIQF